MTNSDINISEVEFLPKPTIHNFIDLEGQTFHRLTVLGLVGRSLRQAVWLCRCECGQVLPVRSQEIRSGHTKSCGCWSRDVTRQRNTIHGLSHLPEYSVWESMRKRCRNNPKRVKDFRDYYSRGITVCGRWDDFALFLEDMGRRPTDAHTIERVDNNKGYSPDNCIWELRIPQANNKRNNRRLEAFGKEQTMAQWERETGIPHSRLFGRLKRGWNIEKALSEPKHINRYA